MFFMSEVAARMFVNPQKGYGVPVALTLLYFA